MLLGESHKVTKNLSILIVLLLHAICTLVLICLVSLDPDLFVLYPTPMVIVKQIDTFGYITKRSGPRLLLSMAAITPAVMLWGCVGGEAGKASKLCWHET